MADGLSAQSESVLKAPEVANIRRAQSFGQYLATLILEQQDPDVEPWDVVGSRRRFKVVWSVGGTDIRRELMMEEMSTHDIDFDYPSSQRSYVEVVIYGASSESNPRYFYFDGYLPPRYAMYFNDCDGVVVSDVVVEGHDGAIMALDSTLVLRDCELTLDEGYESFVYRINSTVEESNVRKIVRT